MDPITGKYPSWSPYNFTFNNPINLTDPDGADPFPPSTFIDENGNVVGGTVNDNDLGVYQVPGLTRANFDVSKISQYKQEGTRVGETYSLYTFLNPETGKWLGKVNFNYEAKNNLLQATKGLGSFMLTHSAFQSLEYYMKNAGNFGIYDIKTLGIPGGRNSSPLERTKYAYEASFVSEGMIMTRRDQGNFFAGRAAKMIGLSKAAMLSGMGAYNSNGNQRNGLIDGTLFYLKVGINWLDQKIMGAAINGTPMQGMRITPIYPEDRISDDLQRAGYNQFQR
ncbi:MAG: hypothetical protein ACRDE2_09640 [Chitinophagaceae bacterium]